MLQVTWGIANLRFNFIAYLDLNYHFLRGAWKEKAFCYPASFKSAWLFWGVNIFEQFIVRAKKQKRGKEAANSGTVVFSVYVMLYTWFFMGGLSSSSTLWMYDPGWFANWFGGWNEDYALEVIGYWCIGVDRVFLVVLLWDYLKAF